MNFNVPENLDFNLMTLLLGMYLILIGVAYYLIFHKHHKRNKVELDELVSLVTKFYSLTMLSTIFICIGLSCIVATATVKYDRSEVIIYILAGIAIISITIINYIFYIKKALRDYDQNVRQANKKRTLKIGEVLLFVFLLLFMLMPIWQIPRFMEIEESKVLIIEIAKSIGISIASIFLLFMLNPIDIKERISNKFKKTENKENKKIYK